MKRIMCLFFLLITLSVTKKAFAQPPCQNGPDGIIYIQGSSIFNYDPSLPVSATNPSTNTIPNGGSGLAITDNFFPTGPSPTFYTTSGGNYSYWNGTVWVNTGHSAGPGTGYVNPGGAGPFIYNYTSGGNISKYDGTGNATLLFNVPGLGSGGPFDVVGHCDGSFFVIKTDTSSTPGFLRRYDPNGVLLQSWTVSGTWGSGGGGFAIVNNAVYYNNTSGFKFAPLSQGTNLNFTNVGATTPSPSDMANCPVCGPSSDTIYHCLGDPPLNLSTSIDPTISWNVVSGSATITGTGSAVSVEPTETSMVLATSSSSTSIDSFYIIVPTATLDAGSDITLQGCATYTDVLNATLNNTDPNLNYTISWEPSANIVNGGNTLTPTITQTTGPITYTITVTTDTAQGLCSWIDTIIVDVDDLTPVANFTGDIRLGCINDTIIFTNTSTIHPTGNPNYIWQFGDGNVSSLVDPTHIYGAQNNYLVTLTVDDGGCRDSIDIGFDLNHPIDADFSIANNGISGGPPDSICLGSQFLLTPVTVPLVIFNVLNVDWYLSDGSQYLNNGPLPLVHTFSNPGTYSIQMIVTDSLGCQDSITKTVYVDQPPFVSMGATPTEVCVGEPVYFVDSVAPTTNSWTYNFGDGNLVTNVHNPKHSYTAPGVYTVIFTGQYLVCPNDSGTINITVTDYPLVNLGPDTSYCPGLTNGITLNNLDNSSALMDWSTGETAASITTSDPGYYWARMNNGTCVSSDTVWVKRDCYLNIPNSFSPNGDGRNDNFMPRQLLSSGVEEIDFKIFNRWGELIFVTNNVNGRGWDGKYGGKDQPSGVFVYVIDVRFKNDLRKNFTGNVTLIR